MYASFQASILIGEQNVGMKLRHSNYSKCIDHPIYIHIHVRYPLASASSIFKSLMTFPLDHTLESGIMFNLSIMFKLGIMFNLGIMLNSGIMFNLSKYSGHA